MHLGSEWNIISISRVSCRPRLLNADNSGQVHVPIDPVSGSGKGFAYVQYNDPDSAVRARELLDGTIFQGRLMHILPAASKREPKIDDVALSKLPVKKQKQIQRKAEAASSTFNWNSLYMNVWLRQHLSVDFAANQLSFLG